MKLKKLNGKKISVLGQEYTIFVKNGVEEDIALENRCGYIEFYAKEIIIDSQRHSKGNVLTLKCIDNLIKESLRHEVIHAFLFESGLCHSSLGCNTWAMNEEMVDFFAMQWNKISKVFNELGI